MDPEAEATTARRAHGAAERVSRSGRLTVADLCDGGAAIRQALATIGGTWQMMTLMALLEGPQRYGALKSAIAGINDRMLTQTLQAFVTDGLVHRHDLGSRRQGVSYQLTELGEEVTEATSAYLLTLMRLAPAVAQARSSATGPPDHRP